MRRKPSPLLPALVLLVVTLGCGGSSTQAAPPPIPISVSVTPATATAQTGSTVKLVATVTNDSSESGVRWAVSCTAPQCGTITPLTTPGTDATYTAPATISGGIDITVTATAVADASKSSLATLIPVGFIPSYDVGVYYHSFGADIDTTGFIGVYDQPPVRQMVQTQLQEMADRGATIIQTGIWVENDANFHSNVGVSFPMTDQEQANIRSYAQDVANVVSASGNRLRLIFTLGWLQDADYTIGSPTTTLGTANLSPAEYVSRVQATTDKILAAVGDITRPDGVKAVETIYFVGEANLPDSETPPGSLTDRGWFLVTNYPYFVTAANKVGIRPAVYFSADGDPDHIFDNSYVDALFPILDGHRSMFQVYRGVNFFLENGLPLPTGRLDFECYMLSKGVPYEQMLQRVLDDADATMPSLGAPKLYNIPETYYLLDPELRLQYGQAFATQAAQNSRLQRVSFWTWPDSGGPGQNATYPFTIEDFLPSPAN